MKLFQILFLLNIIILLLVNSVLPQDQRKIKLANSLAKSGDHEAALELFESMYQKGNISHPVISGIKNAYQNLGKYEDLIVFLEKIIPEQPENFHLQIDLGTTYYQLNKTETAMEIWRSVYEFRPAHQMRYRLVANAMIKLRLFDEAIELYTKAMSELKGQNTMYLDIATLYRARLNYEMATQNYLNYYINFKKKYNYVQSLILSMTKDDEATDRVIYAISSFLNNAGMDPKIKELQAGLYIKKKEFNQAFEIYSGLDEGNRSESYLLKFANEAEKNQAYEYAIKSLKLVLGSTKKRTDINQINYILARNYYRLGEFSGQQAQVNNALVLLKSIENVSTERQVYFQSQELIGDIFHNYYRDYDQAIQHFQSILQQRGTGKIVNRIYLKLGHSFFMKNDLEKAKKNYSAIKKGSFLNVASYYLARLYYFQSYFSEAEKLFQSLISKIKMSDSLANNVLNYTLLISEHKGDSISFSDFARAEKLEHQLKYSEAAELYKSFTQNGNSPGLKAGIRSAKLYSRVNELEESRILLEELTSLYEDSEELDEVFFTLAGVYDKMQNREYALELYRNILTSYPNSFFLEEARDRARDLNTRLIQDSTP